MHYITSCLYPLGQSGFRPRLSAGPPMTDYPVQFPLARPSRNNLMAICIHSDHRPRYPSSYFPASGFGQQKRRASAVNTAESWFSTCCQGNEMWRREATLCCAIQAVSFTLWNIKWGYDALYVLIVILFLFHNSSLLRMFLISSVSTYNFIQVSRKM